VIVLFSRGTSHTHPAEHPARIKSLNPISGYTEKYNTLIIYDSATTIFTFDRDRDSSVLVLLILDHQNFADLSVLLFMSKNQCFITLRG